MWPGKFLREVSVLKEKSLKTKLKVLLTKEMMLVAELLKWTKSR
jgi:hypothetical protein